MARVGDTATKTLPPGWQMVRFEQMVECVADRAEPADADTDYYVGLEHLDPESLKIRRWGSPNDVIGTKLRFKPGDIIFGKRRFYQRKLAVAEREGICSAHAMVLRVREETVLPEFLPFFMQGDIFFERAMSISMGSLSPTINWKTLARQEFAIPPKDEQRCIAEILCEADEVIVKGEALVEAIKLNKRVLIKDIYNTRAGSFLPLGDCVQFVTSGSRGWAKYYTSEGSIFLRVTNLTREVVDIDLGDLQFVSPPLGVEGTRTRVSVSRKS